MNPRRKRRQHRLLGPLAGEGNAGRLLAPPIFYDLLARKSLSIAFHPLGPFDRLRAQQSVVSFAAPCPTKSRLLMLPVESPRPATNFPKRSVLMLPVESPRLATNFPKGSVLMLPVESHRLARTSSKRNRHRYIPTASSILSFLRASGNNWCASWSCLEVSGHIQQYWQSDPLLHLSSSDSLHPCRSATS